MSTIQIVGIAAATVIVLLLIIALVVTRKSGEAGASDAPQADGDVSFLDSSPSDTFAKLGRPEHVSSPAADMGPDTASDAGPEAPPGPAVVMTSTGAAAADGSLGLDWDQSERPSPWKRRPEPAQPPALDESETTGELPAVSPQDAVSTGDDEIEVPAEAPGEIRPATEPEDGLVPLSSIIVTTSTKMVDLKDPDVRHMLTDLVTFEIDQATQFRTQGQSLDAVLQLTEAEKICRALGKHDTAREIRDMMRELRK